jgi:hypothetical protein
MVARAVARAVRMDAWAAFARKGRSLASGRRPVLAPVRLACPMLHAGRSSFTGRALCTDRL